MVEMTTTRYAALNTVGTALLGAALPFLAAGLVLEALGCAAVGVACLVAYERL